jgi:hypothetical protein
VYCLYVCVCVFRYSIGVKIMVWVRVVIFYVGVTRLFIILSRI